MVIAAGFHGLQVAVMVALATRRQTGSAKGSKIIRIYEGANQIQRMARELLK